MPHVTSLLNAGGKTMAGTDDGLWELVQGGKEFRRVVPKNLPASISYLSPSAESLFAIADGQLWRRGSNLEWKQILTPPEGSGLLWAEQNPFAPGRLMIATQRGVFLGEPGGEWRLVSSGLPAIASDPPACSAKSCLIAMSNGGLYISLDEMRTWGRVDSDGERSRVEAIFALQESLFVVGAVQEGMLRLKADSSDR
jgi:hypothetical protein